MLDRKKNFGVYLKKEIFKSEKQGKVQTENKIRKKRKIEFGARTEPIRKTEDQTIMGGLDERGKNIKQGVKSFVGKSPNIEKKKMGQGKRPSHEGWRLQIVKKGVLRKKRVGGGVTVEGGWARKSNHY